MESEESARIGLKILKNIVSIGSNLKEIVRKYGFKILAIWIKSEMSIDMRDFLLGLEYLRKNYLEFYRMLDIPFNWENGGIFPELFLDFLKDRCEIGVYKSKIVSSFNNYWCLKQDLLIAFNQWLEDRKITGITMTRLTKIIEKGDDIQIRMRRINGIPKRIYAGVRIIK
ncbi:MAG: hypothetical protein ACTSPD_18995 [Promethearchaeota archaeon]